MDKLQGSIAALSALQTTADTAGKDAPSKTILRHLEVLAVILKGTVSEYKGYSLKEVQEFIVPDSITNTTEVSPGRSNTKVSCDNTEFIHLKRKQLTLIWPFRPGIHSFLQKISRSTCISIWNRRRRINQVTRLKSGDFTILHAVCPPSCHWPMKARITTFSPNATASLSAGMISQRRTATVFPFTRRPTPGIPRPAPWPEKTTI